MTMKTVVLLLVFVSALCTKQCSAGPDKNGVWPCDHFLEVGMILTADARENFVSCVEEGLGITHDNSVDGD
jgi:hypothetical protein